MFLLNIPGSIFFKNSASLICSPICPAKFFPRDGGGAVSRPPPPPPPPPGVSLPSEGAPFLPASSSSALISSAIICAALAEAGPSASPDFISSPTRVLNFSWFLICFTSSSLPLARASRINRSVSSCAASASCSAFRRTASFSASSAVLTRARSSSSSSCLVFSRVTRCSAVSIASAFFCAICFSFALRAFSASWFSRRIASSSAVTFFSNSTAFGPGISRTLGTGPTGVCTITSLRSTSFGRVTPCRARRASALARSISSLRSLMLLSPWPAMALPMRSKISLRAESAFAPQTFILLPITSSRSPASAILATTSSEATAVPSMLALSWSRFRISGIRFAPPFVPRISMMAFVLTASPCAAWNASEI